MRYMGCMRYMGRMRYAPTYWLGDATAAPGDAADVSGDDTDPLGVAADVPHEVKNPLYE